MNGRKLLASTICAVVFTANQAIAAWLPAPYQPAGLAVGQKYHLVFVTSTVIDGTSEDPTDYVDHVQADADTFGIGTSAGVSWFALVSTPNSEARQQPPAPFGGGGMNGNGIGPNSPVYNTELSATAANRLVATGWADLWDGSIAHQINFQADEDNNHGNAMVWTGSNYDGNNASGGHHMGSDFPRYGRTWSTNSGWISDANDLASSQLFRLYAISEELTVVALEKYWDVNGATPGGSSLTTASGTWSTTDANWSTSVNGDVATQVWNSGDIAVFSAGTGVTGASTITVVDTQTASGITVDEGSIDLTGGSLSLNGAIIRAVGGTQLNVASVITGSGFTKTDSGTLTLSGSNSYTGATSITGGTVRGNSIADQGLDSAFGRGDFSILSAAELEYTGGTAATNRAVTLGSGGGAIDIPNADTNLTISGVIGGVGGLTKRGSGTLTLTGTNPYASTTAIRGGTLSGNTIANIGSSSAFGAGADFDISNGATLQYTGGTASTNHLIFLNNGGVIEITDGNTILDWTGVIDGSGGLTKSGSGTLTLSGNNSFSGDVTISAGEIRGNSIANSGSNSAFGAGSNINISNGAVLRYTGPSASTDRTISLGPGGGRIRFTTAGSAVFNLNGVISGVGDFTKFGSGEIRLGADNTYAGSTIITGGTLSLAASERIPDGSAVSISSGAELDLKDFNETIGSLSGSGSVLLGTGGIGHNLIIGSDNSSTTFSGTISGTNGGGLHKVGSGTLTLSGNNTNTDVVKVSGGTLSGNTIGNIGSDSAFGNGTTDSRIEIHDGATLEYTGTTASTNRWLRLGDNGGIIKVSDENTILDWTGLVSDPGGLTKTGAGTLTLSGNNSFTGAVTISSGEIRGNTIANSGSNSAFGAGNSINISNGATLRYTGPSASTNRTFSLGSGGGTIRFTTAGSAVFTLNAVISGVGDFRKHGSGEIRLGADNTYGGSTILIGGSLSLAASERIPDSSAVDIASIAELNLNGFTETIGSLAGSGSLLLGSWTLNTGGNNSSTTFSGTISGENGGVLHKVGSGTLTLSGNNSNTDVVKVSGGTLSGNTIGNIGSNSAFGNGTTDSRIEIHDGATLEYTGPNASTNRWLRLGDIGGTLSVSNADTVLDWTGLVSDPGSLTKIGAGTLTLSGNCTYAGGSGINGGTLQFAETNSMPSSGVVSVEGSGNSATLAVNAGGTSEWSNGASGGGTIGGLIAGTGGQGMADQIKWYTNSALGIDTTNAPGGALTYGGVIGSFKNESGGTRNDVGLTKLGSGKLILTAANTYTGPTTISGGTLAVNGSINGPVTVNSGGTLGGSGTIDGNVGGNGRVAPGNSPGILTIDGDYTQTDESVLEIEVGSFTGPMGTWVPGTDHDQLQVGGTATLAGRLEVPVIDPLKSAGGRRLDCRRSSF
jgi:autotransporter-associated beta strand protein